MAAINAESHDVVNKEYSASIVNLYRVHGLECCMLLMESLYAMGK